jgi:glycosyltransferase involved in cell wall biosynthesis
MLKVSWITTAHQRYKPDVIQGGMAYDYLAIQTLSKLFDVETIYIQKIQNGNIIARFINEYNFVRALRNLEFSSDLSIRTHFPVAHVPYDPKKKSIAIIHQFYKRPTLDGYYMPFFFNNLKRLDAIITVSKYWQSWFIRKGIKSVYVIYNPFRIKDFAFSEAELTAFRKRNGLSDIKPIIYIGSTGKGKGVEKTYNVLKDLNVTLVCSGAVGTKVRARCFKLEYRDYLCLLKSSQIVIQMSDLTEGWCRVLHEAMLCKVPVIGSGRGGMKELLSGGRQIICLNHSELRAAVTKLLQDSLLRAEQGEMGYEYAKMFSYERFGKEWINLVSEIFKK